VEAWKREFPIVGVGTSFELRQLASSYEMEVMQTTSANIYPTIRRLRERAERDVAEASRLSKSGKGPSARAGKEKQDWLTNQLLPFLRKMG